VTTTSAPAVGRTARRTAAETRACIVAATERIVVRDGVAHLTLEAAAAEAGLSKGGVLYHFPTRDALVAGMVAAMLERFEQEIAAHLPAPGTPDAEAPGAYARAYVAASLAPPAPGEERLGTALLAAAAGDPSLLAPIQAAAEGWQARLVADGLDPDRATALRMACDGLWLCDLFGLAPPTGDLRASVGAFLAGMTEGTK
jgi:AcrR family transcriptional regulator